MRALKAAMLSQRLTLGIGAILLVVSAASIGMDVESRTDVARVDHTLDVLSRIADVRLLVGKAESASRGFAITGDENLAGNFREMSARIPAAFAALKTAVDDTPAQRELLEGTEPSLARRLAVSAELIRLRSDGDSAGIAALTARAEGRAAMERLTANLDRLTAEEQRLLAVRTAQSQSSGRLLLTIDLVGVVMVLILGAFLLRGAYLSNRALVDSLSVFRAAKESLEVEVAVQEQHLGTAQSVLETTFNSVAEAVLVIDTDGGVVLSNPAAERMLGYRPGMSVADLWAVNTFCQTDGVTPVPHEDKTSTAALAGKPTDRMCWSAAFRCATPPAPSAAPPSSSTTLPTFRKPNASCSRRRNSTRSASSPAAWRMISTTC